MADEKEPALTGRCMCERVRFAVGSVPLGFGVCHCRRCQRRTGTGFSTTAPIEPGSLTLLAGGELVRWYDPGDGGWLKGFCSECGSALFTRNPKMEGITAVRMGSFDEDFGAKPGFHQFTNYAPAWAPVPEDGLPRYPERIPAGDLPRSLRD